MKEEDINPFTAMLAAPSLGKRPIKVPNLKSFRLFFPLLFLLHLRMSSRKDLYQNAHYSKQVCYRTIKYTVCRRVSVHF